MEKGKMEKEKQWEKPPTSGADKTLSRVFIHGNGKTYRSLGERRNEKGTSKQSAQAG